MLRVLVFFAVYLFWECLVSVIIKSLGEPVISVPNLIGSGNSVAIICDSTEELTNLFFFKVNHNKISSGLFSATFIETLGDVSQVGLSEDF